MNQGVSMPTVEVARHLHRFFPALARAPLSVEASTVAEVIRALNEQVPGLADYIVDERGALRPHVSLFIGDEAVVDRRSLSDPVAPGARISILQALSGG